MTPKPTQKVTQAFKADLKPELISKLEVPSDYTKLLEILDNH